ncbi:MAG: hypothetical protein H0U59_00945 [Gemmatimonadaceae bacterium]|nr:hypothetical protein [Gemmatimonadaceae bacterium]
MMRVAGIDYSSRYIDLVTVPYEGVGAPVWHRFPLTGKDAFDRTRSVADALPGRTSALYEDLIALGIEHPAGKHGTGALMRIQGAILARLPARLLVEPLPPSKWRQLVGLKGNATKAEVAASAVVTYGSYVAQTKWPQDACDAYCIALATRTLISREQAA